jgi:hypothetical protein
MSKKIYLLTFPIFLLIFSCKTERNISCNQKFNVKNIFDFSLDSGYITKNAGLKLLLIYGLTDTINSSWDLINASDTIAKYYKDQETGHYFICSIDYSNIYNFETHVIFELNKIGELVKKERFFHGNYPCCWNNYFSGFNKYGTFYGINICGTGSGYCAKYLLLFKNLIPQNSQKLIPIEYWSNSGEGETQSLGSFMIIEKNEIWMHYKLDIGILDDSLNFKIDNTREFNVKFKLNQEIWEMEDSTLFEGLDLWY